MPLVPFSKTIHSSDSATSTHTLIPKLGQTQIVPEEYGKTSVWCFNDAVPGPTIRVKQNDWVDINVVNQLEESTTVHWHGIRVPNAMDGVPHLTQPPIAPGAQYRYQFKAEDAGTFWYHPHQRSMEQVGRGLYGPFIVEEANPIKVDRELIWVLDDWKLTKVAQLVGQFGHPHDLSHAGRIGSTVTINGKLPQALQVQSGERIRLRLINAANARIFALQFEGHQPQLVAIDGHPVSPHQPQESKFTLAPAMRMDIVLDMTGAPGESFSITDNYYAGDRYRLNEIIYGSEPLRDDLLNSAIALSPNPIAEPQLDGAAFHEITFDGGAMGGMDGALIEGEWQDIRSMAHRGNFWSINGVSATGHILEPLVTLATGSTAVLRLKNLTRWPHPIHLHGHSFRVIRRNKEATVHQEWQDTVLIEPEESADIAFVADNPGDWMFHCHILEHQVSGMMGVVRVA